MLDADTTIALALRASAWATGLAVCFWLMQRWRAGRAGETKG